MHLVSASHGPDCRISNQKGSVSGYNEGGLNHPRLLRCTLHFRDGSKAAEATEAVRPCTSATPPKADVNSPPWLPPLSARTGLMQCSKFGAYSISSSAA